MKDNTSKLFKQRLQRVHVSLGISFSLLMYIAVFFGIFAILLPYIQVWEKPSRHFEVADVSKINYSSMIDPVISNPSFPKNNIIISLPGYKNDPALMISHLFTKPIVFNPKTQKEVKDEGESSHLAWFLNGMHYGAPLKNIGYTIFGFMAVAGMFLVIGGIILILSIKFSNSGKNKQSKFSKWHRKIFTWVFPPFIIITLTGAMMNIGYSTSHGMTYLASHGKTTDIARLVAPVLYPEPEIVKRADISASMLPISTLIIKAKQINPNIDFQELTLVNWNDKSAQIQLKGYNPYKPFLNGIYNKPTVILSAVDGSLIQSIKVLDKHWTVLFTDSIYFLHLLFGVDVLTRIFISLIMLCSSFALGFGVMLYLEKKAKKFEAKIPFYHWLGKLSLSIMIGVIPSTGFIFTLQWLLPFDLHERIVWQEGGFFVFWLATLTWSFYRISSYKATKEFLYLGGFLFISAVLSHFYVSGFTPIELYQRGMNTILNVDITLFVFGVLLIIAANKVPKNTEEAKILLSSKKNIQGLTNEK